jgi:ferredoxin
MGKEPSSGGKSGQAPGVCPLPEGEDVAGSSPHTTIIGTTIDFHAPEFNQRDGLDDFSGNYRSFEPLGDVITADMRHQEECRRSATGERAKEGTEARRATKSAEAVAEERPASPPPLTVVSQGRVLIVAEGTEQAIACGKLLSEQGLTCTLLVTKSQSAEAPCSRPDGLCPREVDALAIEGAFGGFSAAVTVKGEQEPLTEGFAREPAGFDLVLDLQSIPSYAGRYLPLGYYAPGANPARLADVMEELPEMRGQFRKPQFTLFQKEKCLHGRSRSHDCLRCLEVCPVAAIQTGNKTIAINHYLCQGCGSCALVCPSDAIRMASPSLGEFLTAVLDAIDEGSTDCPSPPTLVISDQEYAQRTDPPHVAGGGPPGWINFPGEQIAHAGLGVVLSALAAGAGRVIVAYGEDCPPKIREALAWQAQMAAAILVGLGMEPNRIRYGEIPSDHAGDDKPAFPPVRVDGTAERAPMRRAALSEAQDKATLVRLATQRLYEQSGVQEQWLPLPAGSPFGAIKIDDPCTLCMACTCACPTGALLAGGDVPRISFRESACHQCGLCAETCPEKAIHLVPRILCDLEKVATPVVVREEEPFRCIECGAPFASQAMINRIRDKLAGHWMYGEDRQLCRLQMCSLCRTRDALSSRNVKLWNRRT